MISHPLEEYVPFCSSIVEPEKIRMVRFTILKYVPKVEAHFGKPPRHFFIFHRIDLVHSGSILGTMWDIFRAGPFEKNDFIIAKMKKKN